MLGQYEKAGHYREQAIQLRCVAENAPDGSSIKRQLLDLARQYDGLAERATKPPSPRPA